METVTLILHRCRKLRRRGSWSGGYVISRGHVTSAGGQDDDPSRRRHASVGGRGCSRGCTWDAATGAGVAQWRGGFLSQRVGGTHSRWIRRGRESRQRTRLRQPRTSKLPQEQNSVKNVDFWRKKPTSGFFTFKKINRNTKKHAQKWTTSFRQRATCQSLQSESLSESVSKHTIFNFILQFLRTKTCSNKNIKTCFKQLSKHKNISNVYKRNQRFGLTHRMKKVTMEVDRNRFHKGSSCGCQTTTN